MTVTRQHKVRTSRPLVWAFIVMIFIAPFSLSAAPENRAYDAKLLRLSEILGAIHYLRALCGANDGQIWRDKMQSLLDSEGVNDKRRIKLIKRFNKGYQGFKRTYRNCTPSAESAIAYFIDEGVEISEDLIKKHSQ